MTNSCNSLASAVLRQTRRATVLQQSAEIQHVFSTTAATSSSRLRTKWPALLERFRHLQNSHGVLPLFPQKMSQLPPERAANGKRAAVLVLLSDVDGEVSLLFTKRSGDLKQHAAEISFPGGHVDPVDGNSPAKTALREAEEELVPLETSLLREKVDILGEASSLPSLNGTPVTPVIGALWHDLTSADLDKVFPGAPQEVDAVFAVSVRDLLDKETSRPLPKNRFGISHGPIYPSMHGEIWGLTAYILRPLLRNLLKPVLFEQG